MENSTPTTIQVWTKADCVYCVMAKEELSKRNMNFKEHIIGVNANRAELLKMLPDAKTVPQIFFDDEHIGGYDELMGYFLSLNTKL